MNITLHGAAGEVTGSAYHVQTRKASVMVDFGLFQGRYMADQSNHVPRNLNVDKLDAVVLTHAHLDHTGRLPLLVKRGYKNPIYATPASLEIAQLILEDAAKLQEQDATRENRKRAEKDKPPLSRSSPRWMSPAVVALFKPLPYLQPFQVAPGVTVRMFEAGHILGSTSIEMTLQDSGVKRTVVFSGDLGPRNSPILRDSACLTHADLVFMESTYGDRDHRSLADTVAEFRSLITDAVAQKGKILVPTFAVGRAQQLQYHLANMLTEKIVPPFPVILDSPMAIKATRLHEHHPELFDDDMKALAADQVFLKHMASIRHSVTADDSRALNELPGPCLIMAGAGMCNAGRILHHLRQNLSASQHRGFHCRLPGSRLARPRAHRRSAGGAHLRRNYSRACPDAQPGRLQRPRGQTDLLKWFECLAPKHPRVVLTHGEDRGRLPLAEIMQKRYQVKPVLPQLGDVIEV